MARRFVTTVVATAGGNTFSNVFLVDDWNNPCNIGVGVSIDFGGSSAIYSVQHSFDDPFTINLNNRALGTWRDNAILTSVAAAGDTNYAFPPTAIRLKLYAAASVQATMTVIQAGPEN